MAKRYKKPIMRIGMYGSSSINTGERPKYYVYKDYGNRIEKLKMGFKTKTQAEKYRESLRK